MVRRWRGLWPIRLLVLLATLAGCGGAGAVAPLPPAPTATPVPTPVSAAAPWLKPPPAPVALPADEAPHDVLTEWWYYTGHLDAADGHRYGFEYVIFQVRLGETGPGYLSHFAVTDKTDRTFRYDQRQTRGPQAQPTGGGFALAIGDWTMAGRDGRDHLRASMPGHAIDLTLTATKPPALHLGTGFISFGAAGDSYYYSRTRMAVEGTVVDGDVVRPVRGEAWFDHQWGDFINVKGGGWDWFALQLDDQTEVMIFDVRDPFGRSAILYGSLIDARGATIDLPPGSFSIETLDRWTSPRSGGVYPSRWRVRLPTHGLDLTVAPVIPDQELDTAATTSVIYWEGAVEITGTRGGQPIAGRGYVELTGYAK
jgi:predicted secreted hydrolase